MVEPGTYPDPDEPQDLTHADDAEAPAPEQGVEDVEAAAEVLEEGPASPNALAKVLGAIGPVASRAMSGTAAAAGQVAGLARAYPRASIATGLSALVLCGVFSLRSGRTPVVAIPPPTGSVPTDPAPQATEADTKEGTQAEPAPVPPPPGESVAESPAPVPTPGVPEAASPPPLLPTPEPDEPKLADSAPLPDLPTMVDARAGDPVLPAPAPAPAPEPVHAADAGASLLAANAGPLEDPEEPAPAPTPAVEAEKPTADPVAEPAAPTPPMAPEVAAPSPTEDAPPAPAPVEEAAPIPAVEPEHLSADPAPPPAAEPSAPSPPSDPAPPALADVAPPAQSAPAQSPAAEPEPSASAPPSEAAQPAPFPALGAIAGAVSEAVPRAAVPPAQDPEPAATPVHAATPAEAPVEASNDDWIPIKHSAGMVKLGAQDVDVRDGVDPITGESDNPLRDARRADDETPIRFVPVATKPAAAAVGAAAGVGAAAKATSQAVAPDEGRMDTVLHKVQAGENFWTISRTHYASGRYYRALGKANADQFQRLEDLYVGAVIRIPPPEDLDPAFIDPPGGKSSRNRDPAEPVVAPAKAPRTAAGGTPVRRGRLDGELELPVSDPSTERTADTGERRRASSREDSDVEEPAATSRRAESHPVHKVRPRETLRTIARDRLGDSRRAREILDLNRDAVTDPARLPVGQVLALPDDAE